MTSAISIMWVTAIMTILLSQPCISSELKWERILGNVAAGLVGVTLGHAAFEALVEHGFEVLAPAVGIAAGHDDGGGLFYFGLVVRGGAEAFLLLFPLDDDEAPGLHVVAAGRAEASVEDFAEVFGRNGCAVETRGSAPLADRLTQWLFLLRRLDHCRSFYLVRFFDQLHVLSSESIANSFLKMQLPGPWKSGRYRAERESQAISKIAPRMIRA